MGWTPALRELLARQHGAISRAQMLELGCSSRSVERRLEAGELVRVHPGVYRTPIAPITELQRLWAAVIAAGPEGVVSHRSAAQLWDLRGISARQPEISVIHERPRLEGCHLHRMQNLVAPDVVERADGLRVTSVPRTLLDLGAVVRPEVMGRAAIDALHRRLAGWDQLAQVLAREGRRGRAGTAALRRFMAREDQGVAALESELEVRFWELVTSSDLDLPVRQHTVRVGGRVCRLDFAYLDIKFDIELDGVAWHGTAADRRRDRERDRALTALGWTVRRFGWEEVVWHGSTVLAEIAAVRALLQAA